MKNKLTDLRNHMFAALEGLMDEEKPMDVERAHAVANIGKVIVETAKVEVQALKYMNGNNYNNGSMFVGINAPESQPAK